MRKTLLLLLLISLMALAACAPPVDIDTSPRPEKPSLVGPTWSLNQLNGAALLASTTITARFSADGSLSGSDGCNNYTVSYSVDGNTISISAIAGTQMACDPALMEQAQAYAAALVAAATYAISGDKLTLKDSNGAVVAAYTAQKQALADTSWQVISYNNGREAVVSVMLGSEITANFGGDGQITGNAGCNDYAASYSTVGDAISIGPATSTRMFCEEPAGVMDQEVEYLTALQSAATYSIEGVNMEMRTAEGALAVIYQRSN